MGKAKSRVARVVVRGPLAPYAERFRGHLIEAGYTPLSAVVQLRLMAHLSTWLAAGGLGVGDLHDGRVREFVALRRSLGRSGLVSPRAMQPLLGFLRPEGVLPAEEARSAMEPVEVLLASFRHYLLTERGLTPTTARSYLGAAARLMGGTGVASLSRMGAADVSAAVLTVAATQAVSSTQNFATAIRCFLRFCLREGYVSAGLADAALGSTGRRRSLLPVGLKRQDAIALLAACDRRRGLGRRDYAVLLLLLRLGLRAGEVARLSLDDVDWRSGEVVVRGKGRRDEALPLPVDVGEAMVAYLRRGRPSSQRRQVFLSATAPCRPLTREAVGSIVRRASKRAGVDPVGPHRLRHAAACEMLAAGVGLGEIGQVLRHASLVTTANYARVDVESLRSLARPWPGGDHS